MKTKNKTKSHYRQLPGLPACCPTVIIYNREAHSSHPIVLWGPRRGSSLFFKWCLPPVYPALCTDTNLAWNWVTLPKPGLQECGLHWAILLTGQFMLQSRKIIKNYILRASTFKRLYLGKITVSYLHLSDASTLERGPGNITILNENCFLNVLPSIRST